MRPLDPESQRLQEDEERKLNWKRWGPYLSERQWGTVREDYSDTGDSWSYFPHDHARSRAYRWGEDGLLGITDRQCRLCFALAFWNGQDPILKERLFGLSGPEGNHGEDVKECYFYLDSTPTHSYMRALYKYPVTEFPYRLLVEEHRRRSRQDTEWEVLDTGVFEAGHFDILVEYAKGSPNDILIRIQVSNRSSQTTRLHLLPTLWFRNTWSWGRSGEGYWARPELRKETTGTIRAQHPSLGTFHLAAEGGAAEAPALLFTENETNRERLGYGPNASPFVKDAFHRYLIAGDRAAVNPLEVGTKGAFHYPIAFSPGQERSFHLRLWGEGEKVAEPFDRSFRQILRLRREEANLFYSQHLPATLSEDRRGILRQLYGSLFWNKQFYHYVVKDWLEGDPAYPPPPTQRRGIRNGDWGHLYNRDVISMPDKWEYPWYAAWDLAFHMIPFARVDPYFAKQQLILFLREWYMHPNGQLPAYEYEFSQANPPVHAWACWRVYKIAAARKKRDRLFLERTFQKLLLNFTWWVNRKDRSGHHIFSGGFLGLDNIGVFDRSQPLPEGEYLEQADGTSWMAFYCTVMLSMALELAQENPAYEDVASKFFEHFIAISDAMNRLGGTGLWDEQDGFYYDQLSLNGQRIPLRIRSMVGIIPLFAVAVIQEDVIARLPGFARRMNWFLFNRRDLACQISCMQCEAGSGQWRRLLAIPSRDRLERVLQVLLDEGEFLSPFGIRSLSKIHENHPFRFSLNGQMHEIRYVPGESDSDMFGGNSNWRGPIWFPVNFLLIEALEAYHHFYGETLLVECPTGSGQWMNLRQVAREISRRLIAIFTPDEEGRRPCHNNDVRFARDRYWKGLLWFHEYFHGETGKGLGANHQTGWTALLAHLLEDAEADRVS